VEEEVEEEDDDELEGEDDEELEGDDDEESEGEEDEELEGEERKRDANELVGFLFDRNESMVRGFDLLELEEEEMLSTLPLLCWLMG